MRSNGLAVLFLLSLVLNLVASRFVTLPGYMDAYYYFGGARQLVQGRGFTEPYVWNYLDDPSALPHPSHLYWMPLTSIVATGSMRLLGDSFRAAQVPFVLLAALIAPLSAWLAWRLTGDRGQSLVAGGLALFPGFYQVFWPNTDAFALYGLFGAGCFIAAWRAEESGRMPWWGVSGVLAGLGHLARADGVLLLVVVLAWAAVGVGKSKQKTEQTSRRSTSLLLPVLLLLSGYFAVMLPWYLRNYLAVGSVFAPGGSAALWLKSYDELFRLHPPTWREYLSLRGGEILRGKWQPLLSNLQTAVAVQGVIYLWPFALWGGWKLRSHLAVKLAGTYYALLFALMTFGFSFPGARGGLFHSGAAVLPFVFALAPAGVTLAVRWAAARREAWRVERALPVMSAGAVALGALVTGLIFYTRVIGPDWRRPQWNRADQLYAQAGDLVEVGKPVAVNNPPAYYFHTGQPAIVIPDGPVADLLEAADRFGARYVLLEANHPAALQPLYRQEEVAPRLHLLARLKDGLDRPAFLFELLP